MGFAIDARVFHHLDWFAKGFVLLLLAMFRDIGQFNNDCLIGCFDVRGRDQAAWVFDAFHVDGSATNFTSGDFSSGLLTTSTDRGRLNLGRAIYCSQTLLAV